MIAVRPPEFAPRLDYAALLLAADRVVLADTFAFSRQGGHNRTRIGTGQGPQWLTIPRRHGGVGVPMAEVPVVDDGWRRRHLAAIRAAYGRASFYEHVAPEWAATLETRGSLAELAVASVRFAARWLRADVEIVRASELPGAPDTLATVLAHAGDQTLLTLPESAERDAESARRPVAVLRFTERERRQSHDGWTPGLGVLDLLMAHGPAAADVLRAGIDGVDPVD
ncbi:WbqC family protein [Rubrivirga sp. IMCC43871]|uniref:WbqC family protein n=1 Tax=Rubrivirga sp. IMCC43871 TaxID=3391575 RepID=UPI00398FEC75